MKVKVKYTAQLKKAIGVGEEWVELESGALLKDLLEIQFQKRKNGFLDMVFNGNGEFLGTVLLIVNGRQVNFEYSETLKENDVVTIMSPIAGG